MRSSGFKDHFSGVAATYADFRPTYPAELFAWLAGQTTRRDLAWDCATGSGQAAVGLACHFNRVIATDASTAQIEAAESHPAIEYRIAPAEASGLPDGSVDLVTVAQALHWFDLERFYAEARRVLKPGGLLAVWTYGIHTSGDAAIDGIMRRFYSETVGPYWPPERTLVESGYRTLPFPFEEFIAPTFTMQVDWTLPQLLGYFRSWSATSRFAADQGFDPVNALETELLPLWGSPGSVRSISWPLSIRIGRA